MLRNSVGWEQQIVSHLLTRRMGVVPTGLQMIKQHAATAQYSRRNLGQLVSIVNKNKAPGRITLSWWIVMLSSFGKLELRPHIHTKFTVNTPNRPRMMIHWSDRSSQCSQWVIGLYYSPLVGGIQCITVCLYSSLNNPPNSRQATNKTTRLECTTLRLLGTVLRSSVTSHRHEMLERLTSFFYFKLVTNNHRTLVAVKS